MFGFDMFETYKVTFEIYIGDSLVQTQTLQAPKEILMANFLQTAQQLKKDSRPMKIRMTTQDIIWDKFENKQKILNNEVSASNNAMVSWEENKQGGNK